MPMPSSDPITAAAIVLLTAVTAGQKPLLDATPTADEKTRKEVATLVAKAHRPGGLVRVFDRYSARIRLQTLGQQDNVAVDLWVLFAKAIERAPGKSMEMARYRIQEGDKTIQSGRDADGPWQVVGGEASNLRDRKWEKDRERIQRDTRLCRQMLRYLDPGALLDGMQGDTPVQKVKLQVGRKAVVDAWLCRGRVQEFPVFRDRQQAAEGPVEISAWVDCSTHHLRALEVHPLDEKGDPVPALGEFVFLDEFVAKDGVLLPRSLRFYELDARGAKAPKVMVLLLNIDLAPNLDRDDFARPK